uniref:WD repeat domain 36 n=1 Tax=Crocodylus porosus TaxID=8502 RepID=A0A7M4EFM2_CROPO
LNQVNLTRGHVLFAGFRALGMYSGSLPHVLRFHQRHREFYLVVAVGSSFHTYNVSGNPDCNALLQDITCLAADRMLVFASYGSLLHAFARNKEVVHIYEGHKADIHLLQPFGDHVISVDVDNVLIVWDVQSEEEYLQMNFDKAVFAVSAIMHPSTYLNKILLGSEQGSLQLWNIKSNKLLHSFPGWGSGVTTLEQAPAVDVVAIGLVSGYIIVHNIKFDETLMKFEQDWGPVTTISFRTDGHPVMAAGSAIGHIALWDLEEKKLISQMRNAHTTAIAGLSFVHGEPLLITNGADNAIRIWIFDGPGGGGRLLRYRMGHSAPPTKIRYHGQNGQQILSAGQDGTLQSFSTVHERFNKSLGHGSINKKKSKKKGLRYDTLALPPIMAFASVDISTCGNFAVIGLSTGHVDVYNMQSGIHRGRYGKEKAHEGAIRGVAVDGLNQLAITAGSDGLIKFWKFKTTELVHSTNLASSLSGILLHRDSGILGIASDDFSISVLDVETRKIVRKFSGHLGKINDMAFSPDGRWLISASMDCTIKTWDLPSGCLIDSFLLDSAAVSITMSPTGDFLASSHVDDLGIYLWSNRSLYSLVSLRPLPTDHESSVIMLPRTCPAQGICWMKMAFLFQFLRLFYCEHYNCLSQCFNTDTSPLNLLKVMGPSNIETELRGLAPEGGGSVEVMQSFLRLIGMMLNTKCDFELAQAYLALFLKLHLKITSSEPALLEEISKLSAQLEETWVHLQTLFNQSLCVLNYMKSALL